MKEEDADWLIYHLIGAKTATAEDLAKESGFDLCDVESSLSRLERCFMIHRKDGSIRVMGVGEALMCSQIKYSNDMPFIIEDGVIKEKKK